VDRLAQDSSPFSFVERLANTSKVNAIKNVKLNIINTSIRLKQVISKTL